MDKEYIKQLMKENFEEVEYEEYCSRNNDDDIEIFYGNDGGESIHFKLKQKFPIVFEGKYFNFEVTENGFINQYQEINIGKWTSHRLDEKDILALKSAIEKVKELRE